MRKLLKNLFWVAVVVGAIGGILRATLFMTWTIPTDDPILGASLAPTLAEGDLVLLLRSTPKVGDLVRCADPDQPGRFVVGRLVAEQGEHIQIESIDFAVDNKRSAYEMACSPGIFSMEDPASGATVELHCSYEAFRGSKHLRATFVKSSPPPPYSLNVSDGNVFLLSDNRAFPFDSRRYGAVPKTTCKESVVFRLKGKKGYSDEATRFMGIH